MSEHLRPDVLSRLRSKDATTRSNAAQQLCKQIVDTDAGGNHGNQNLLYSELNSRLAKNVGSSDIHDLLESTAILSALVDVDTLNEAQRTRIPVQLKILLKQSNQTASAEAVEVYKKLVNKKWTTFMSLVETDLSHSLEWLANERNKVLRMTALHIIEALCTSTNTALFPFIPKILTQLSSYLRDHKYELRIAASRALGACLGMMSSHDTVTRVRWLSYLYEEQQQGHGSGSVEGYHAALLICQELIQHGGMYMQANFAPTSDLALKLKDHRDPVVHKAAISLLPVLARYSPRDFTKLNVSDETLMARSCSYLIGISKTSERDRATAFLALGQIAQSCSAEFKPFLESITRAIKDVLAQRVKLRATASGLAPEADETAQAILQTIAMLATAMGPTLTRYMREILDLMFTTGLSQALCDSLAVLEREVSQLVPAIRDRLLDVLSIILVNVPFRPAQPSLDSLELRMGTMSLHYASQSSSSHGSGDWASIGVNGVGSSSSAIGDGSESTSLVVVAARNIAVTTDITVLALHTLGNFDFGEENLSEFVQNVILHYLSHQSAAVRKEAIHAVSRIVLSDPLYRTMAGAGVEVASEVVQRLVAAAVTDIDADVRLMAVKMLELSSSGTNNFGFHIGKAQNIQALSLLMNDEVFEVRLTVLAAIARLVTMNPALVMPSLRRVVAQLLIGFEFARSSSEREECIQLLMVLVRSAESWVRPCVGEIFRTILPRIDDGSPQLASKLLDTVAALARVGGGDLVPHLDKLLTSIMHALSDQSSAPKRMSALKALNNCASHCGLVISPYLKYPRLFTILADLVKTESSDMSLEAMRAIGALGAIDPHQYKAASSKTGSAGASAGSTVATADKAALSGKKGAKHGKRGRHTGPPPNVMTVFSSEEPCDTLVGDIVIDSYGREFSGDKYYLRVSTEAILNILNDPAETPIHQQAVQALISMFRPLQNFCAPFLGRIVPAMLRAMKMAPPNQADFYVETLGSLVCLSRQLIRPYLEPMFELFDPDAPGSDQLQSALVSLIEVLAEALSGDLGSHISTVLPFLVSVIDRDTTETRQVTDRTLHALRILSPSLEGYLFLVMPRLVLLLDLAITPINVTESTLVCISSIVTAVNCNSFASRTILKLIQLLQCSPTQQLQTLVIDTLCTLMEQLQDEFTLFMPTISATMKKRGIIDHEKYDRYSRLLFSGRLIPKDAPRLPPLLLGDTMQADAGLGQANSDGVPRLYMDANVLCRAWAVGQSMAKGEWADWLAKFSNELVRQSPSPALRACYGLASKHPRLSRELFNAAFVSCWTELSGQYQQEIVSSLQEVASKPDAPAEVLQTILSLAGYMERDEKQIQIDIKLLGDCVDRCHALAKGLHYKEAEWMLEKNYETIEKLIELNQNLDLHDSAVGILSHVRSEQPDICESVEWYQRLQRWDDALSIYQRQEAEEGPSYDNTNGQLRCMFEMSDWDSLLPLFERIWSGNDHQLQMASANIGMSMAWTLGDIENMEFYKSKLPNNSKDKSFCTALLSVYHNKWDEAKEHISKAREEIREDLVSRATESYSRGHQLVFNCQMLTELEEVVIYKTLPDDAQRQAAIVSTWRQRLKGMQQDIGMWQKLLRLHSMVLRPILDLDTWIKYVNMCRKSEQMTIARHAIVQLLQDEANYLEEMHCGDIELQQLQHSHGRGLGYLTAGKSNGMLANSSLDRVIRLSQQPALVYMYLKYKWAVGERKGAFQMIEMFANDYSRKVGFDLRNPEAFADNIDACALDGRNGHVDDAKTIHLLSRFYFKRAEWLVNIQQTATMAQEAQAKAGLGTSDELYSLWQGNRTSAGACRSRRDSVFAGSGVVDTATSSSGLALPGDSTAMGQKEQDTEYLYKLQGDRIEESILESYRAATVLDRKWYKAWHSLALQHYVETQKYDEKHSSVTANIIERHVVPAVQGFFRAIQLSKSDTTLQDTLRLLTAWFNYSRHESVVQAVLDGLSTISIRTWLQVIPQILARIHIKYEGTSQLIKQLLVEMGKSHPHAILFSLYVAARSDHSKRSQVAKDVLAKLHNLLPEVVEETEVVSRELIRVTLLFPEMWEEALGKAYDAHFRQNDPEEMVRILRPLHERARNPVTLREYHFVQMFGTELAMAEKHVKRYFAGDPGPSTDAIMQQAWVLYFNVHQEIPKFFAMPTSLALKDTAPMLLRCRDMHLAMPGTYDPDRNIVHIGSFNPVVGVDMSKQRPRHMHITGSDGNVYRFVLKGHEDLRQDERVMQLFGLINSLLTRDSETAQRSLAIERFPVIPLSSNSGLIGFYPDSPTLDNIIVNYRKMHSIPMYLECLHIAQFAPNWETLTVLQKVEAFVYAKSNTPSNDLQRALWYKSPNAEMWLERRTNYTRSLAVMSIAGYILGLGDRHPKNIMMHDRTGKIVHIDLGDCFELAALRDKFPEKVPFRLTRMLIMSMEVSTIEGTFKFSANHTMRVLRANRDSLMAVLEAFVFDPLVSWLYIQDPDNSDDVATAANRRQPPENGANNRINQEQLARWSAAGRASRANYDAAGIALGSRPDEPRGSFANNSEHNDVGVDDWQVGNPKARAIVKRIHDKLVGTDFAPNKQLDVAAQIDRLIQQATSSENLAEMWGGWAPLW
ncbi:phosphatidylinositol kinase- protein kinase tor1 [Coemansia sp. S146]|nr:phosphatidylinositol kinase- protein kinase tor1 [Coemansia sp. S146]